MRILFFLCKHFTRKVLKNLVLKYFFNTLITRLPAAAKRFLKSRFKDAKDKKVSASWRLRVKIFALLIDSQEQYSIVFAYRLWLFDVEMTLHLYSFGLLFWL